MRVRDADRSDEDGGGGMKIGMIRTML